MLLTASKMAACSIVKLRVECIVGDWAPGVRAITRRVLFHSMTGFTDCEAEARWSSLLVTVMLAKPVTELQKPAHRNASVNTLFSIEFTSPVGFSVRMSERGRTTDAWQVYSPSRITEKGELYSKFGQDFTNLHTPNQK